MTETIDVDVSGIRSALLEVIGDLSSQYDNLQSSSVIQHAARKVLNRQPDRQVERALLASFYDLFRTGYLSWGHDLANPAPPFCHVTELGRRALAQRSRDPANPEGYLSHLRSRAGISSLTHSYVVEHSTPSTRHASRRLRSWWARPRRVSFFRCVIGWSSGFKR